MHPMLNIAIRAARKAGNHIAKSLEKADSVQVSTKGFNDLVTNIDKEAEAMIIESIKSSYPEHCFAGEELGVIEGRDKECQWIIDPLDGTANFVRGLPHYAVSIALKMRGRIEVACVYDPMRNELFTATRGQGAQLNNQRIRASQPRDLTGCLIGTGFPFRAKQHTESYMNLLTSVFTDSADVRRSGSAALDLCYVAAGRLDGFFEFGLKPWDIAAGDLIAREAGAITTDFTGNTNYLASGNVVCGNPRVVKPLLAKIREHANEGMMK
uniref:inositol-1-monophosphatase n=1 Tax=Thaumasiovibrio occultus TaxID=1891184 RepID=UPI000B354AD2|nr:inositol-1-monophosphatase [Thaumasiovibrio occultus]